VVRVFFQVDSNGNTILHLLVIHNLPEMYIKFKKHWEEVQTTAGDASSREAEDDKHATFPCAKKLKIPLWKHCNNDGLTPLTLAAKLGGADIFSFLLNERKIVQWRYGPVSCVLYPLDEIDLAFQEVSAHRYTSCRDTFILSILIQNQNTSVGALELIVQNARVELITHPRLIDLVTKKWERFARRSFYRRFFVTLTYLLIFLITTILDQTQIKTVRVLHWKTFLT
jgi:ankyrin repeat protein